MMAVINGTSGDDSITGTTGNDTIYGHGGNDVINGSLGDDIVYGGEGNDTFTGEQLGDGADEYHGGNGDDRVTYEAVNSAGGGVGVTASLASGLGTGGAAAGDKYFDIEHLRGSEHNDHLTGDGGDNEINGGSGHDQIFGGAGNDILNGDNIGGPAGNDILDGGDGDDLLFGDDGNDTLIGSSGNDTVTYQNSGSSVFVNLRTGSVSGGHASGDSISGIENVTGSSSADIFTSDVNDNVLNGGAGIDTARYLGNIDQYVITFDSGSGNYTVSDIAGNTVDGSDTLISIENIEFADQTIDLTIPAPTATDSIIRVPVSGESDWMLTGSGGVGTLTYVVVGGTAGSDSKGNYTTATTTAGATIKVYENGDYEYDATGAQGQDSFDFVVTDSRNISSTATVKIGVGEDVDDGSGGTIDFTVGHDSLEGTSGADTINGGDGDDLLIGGAGGDTLYGGNGIDTVDYSASSARVIVDVGNFILPIFGAQALGGDATGDTLTNIENITGSDFADVMFGDENANVFLGGDGNDFLYSSEGADTLNGGNGIDIANYNFSDAAVTINLALGTGLGGYAEGDTLVSIEYLDGSAFGDTFIGDANANILEAEGGDDILEGGAGGDTVRGGGGNDTASYNGSNLGVTITLTNGFATGLDISGGHADGDILSSIENLTGSDHDDELTGDVNANFLKGGAGDDILAGDDGDDALLGEDGDDEIHGGNGNDGMGGGNGDDILYGGAGHDSIDGNSGNDVLYGGAGNDFLNFNNGESAPGNDILFGQDGDDFLIGFGGVDVMHGGNGNDSLTAADSGDHILNGDAGIDTLVGGAGDNALNGGANNDTITGGGGDDLFIFDDVGGTDTVNDFTAGNATEDRLDISAFAFADLAAILAVTTDDGNGNTTIQLDVDDAVTLIGVEENDFILGDFIL